MTAYLKCKYYENPPMITFSHEYMVTFKCADRHNPKVLLGNEVFPPEGEEWCMVDRKDVVPVTKNNGLVRIVAARESEEAGSVIVGLKDNGDMRISFFKVSREEVEVK